MLFSDNTWEETKLRAKQGFNIVKNWLKSFKLFLSLEKTNYITFSPINVSRPNFDKICLDNSMSINSSNKVKYLGLIIDQYLKLTHRIKSTILHISYSQGNYE